MIFGCNKWSDGPVTYIMEITWFFSPWFYDIYFLVTSYAKITINPRTKTCKYLKVVADWMFCLPPSLKFIHFNLNPPGGWYLEMGASDGNLRLTVHGGRVLSMGLVSLQQVRDPSFLSTMWGNQEKNLSPEPDHAGTGSPRSSFQNSEKQIFVV